MMRKILRQGLLACLLIPTILLNVGVHAAEPSPAYPADMLTRVRSAATMIPGQLAVAANFAKVAESHRPYADIIDGGNAKIFITARTAFQIVYPDSTIMIDSGMDKEVHQYYGFGKSEPYFQAANDEVQAALQRARQILITHEHGDHIAGVIRSPYLSELAPKTILTKGQTETLRLAPQLPQIALTAEQSSRYIVVDYELLMPIAPGIVLIKSPGHTAGHQMIYVRLTKDREFLFIGDVAWSIDNITQLKLRPASTIARIKEDPQALMQQMVWIKQIMDQQHVTIIPSHDDDLLKKYVKDGILGDKLAQ
jgi:glyoxylase-like metal-dependent hydrolase (beta-lactamase superfamily II)